MIHSLLLRLNPLVSVVAPKHHRVRSWWCVCRNDYLVLPRALQIVSVALLVNLLVWAYGFRWCLCNGSRFRWYSVEVLWIYAFPTFFHCNPYRILWREVVRSRQRLNASLNSVKCGLAVYRFQTLSDIHPFVCSLLGDTYANQCCKEIGILFLFVKFFFFFVILVGK